MRMRTTPNAQARILKLAYSCLSASEDAGSGMATIDDEFDEIVRSAPDAMFDCRTYYWPNYRSPVYITHSFSKFTFSFTLPTTSTPGSYYVVFFGEPLLLTWVGLEAKVRRQMGSSTEIQINAIEGGNHFTSDHTNIFNYCKVPTPIRRQERASLLHVMTEDSIDTGLAIHIRIRKEYSVELKVRLPHDNSTTLINPKVVLKVQTPTLVGGDEDHPLWDKYKYLHFHGDKTRKHFPSYLEYKTWMNNINKNSNA